MADKTAAKNQIGTLKGSRRRVGSWEAERLVAGSSNIEFECRRGSREAVRIVLAALGPGKAWGVGQEGWGQRKRSGWME